MPEKAQSKTSNVSLSKSNSSTKVDKDERTGAGVSRLSGTTQKVSLKEGSQGPAKEKNNSQKSGKGTSQATARATSAKTPPVKKNRHDISKSSPSIDSKTEARRSPKGRNATKKNTSRENASDSNQQGLKKEGTEASLAIETVTRENEFDENGEESNDVTVVVETGVDEQIDAEQNGDAMIDSVAGESEQGNNDLASQQNQNEVKFTESPPKEKEFDVREFSSAVGELSRKFSEERFTHVGENYPVDDLLSLIGEVNTTIEHYKDHTLTAQQQLEILRERMEIVRDNIHDSVQTRVFHARQEQEPTVEQKELAAKLAKINAEVAHANVELARIVRMSTEAESLAVEAAESVVAAREEAERIRAEEEWRERKAVERQAEEERRAEEERIKREHEEKLEADARKKQEQEWKRRETAGAQEGSTLWESWPTHAMEIENKRDSDMVGCIIRGDPAYFHPGSVSCCSIDQLESTFTFEQNEELVSPILKLDPKYPDVPMQSSIYVAIPFFATRSSMLSREPVVKAEINGEWKEVVTKEVNFDEYKEKRFAQAEISEYTNVAVVTRFKRDYVTLSKRTSKIVFSADQRISLTTPRSSFGNKELLMLQVQPVDSTSLNDLKNRDKSMKGLLNSSPLVTTKWERANFTNVVTITVPCPPNPAKARKLAAMRAAKEAKMNQPVRAVPVPIDVQEKESRKKKKQQQQQEPDEEITVRKKETRWYMGAYGGSDDDENDNLYLFHQFSTGRWALIPDVKIHPVKLDVLQFELEQPVERFVILRTRTNVDDEMALHMITTLEAALAKRSVRVILRQRVDDPFEAKAHVVTSSRVEKIVKQLDDDGYEDGPKVSTDVTVAEGDIIEIGFRGNIKNQKDSALQIPFNSNMPSGLGITLSEVDPYLQRNFALFRGFVQIFRKYPIIKKPDPRHKFQQKSEEDEAVPEPEPVLYQRELLTELMLNIPKYHIPPIPVPTPAPIRIVSPSDPVNEDLVRHIAEHLGEEWYRLAQHLNIRHSRIQSIIRNTQAQEESEDFAKYQMMMTWLKRAPRASNKVDALSTALARTGRYDLADDLRMRYQQFQEQHQHAQECV